MIALEAVTSAQACERVAESVATIWEQLAHTVYWNDIMLARIAGKTPATPSNLDLYLRRAGRGDSRFLAREQDHSLLSCESSKFADIVPV